jgi:hypothetical protein
MTLKTLLVYILLLSFSTSAMATDYYCNGQYKTSGSTRYYPNGQYVNSGSTRYFPNGQYANSGSTRYYPNGQYMNSGSTRYYPNGQYMNSGSTRYYSNGQYINSGSTCYFENGTTMGTCPATIKVKTSVSDMRLTYTIDLKGSELLNQIDFEIPGDSIVVSFSLDYETADITDLDAQCNGNVTEPGKDILDLYRSSAPADQKAARAVICR